VINSN